VADCSRLENERGGNSTAGSNPAPSANRDDYRPAVKQLFATIRRRKLWPKPQDEMTFWVCSGMFPG
jgi:hypothetical protein